MSHVADFVLGFCVAAGLGVVAYALALEEIKRLRRWNHGLRQLLFSEQARNEHAFERHDYIA